MRYIGWTILITFWVCLAAFLHYTLPHRDIVRIVSTYEERQQLNDWTRIFWSRPDEQSDAMITRDVQFIQGVRANGKPIVYRNEDTGWSWPPYFKFDTANLYTEAADAVSTRAAPEWYVVTHYGWRNEFFSAFPNAISIRQVDGPDASKGIYWVNIIILTLLFAFFYAIWVRWRRFRQARIDPKLEELQDSWEAAGDAVDEKRGRFRRWLDTWKSK
ncbi:MULTISPECIES: DUF1523 family protein [unclassified Tateyamaria]|jgi:hypothetical protein|uniref:DUF1523 family protein n=1 Tax=unclassified Tateyamaria TaxID=2645127 RepID=UPI000D55504E|nr:DUF1523 family protein [Tateyamaria sp. Alg231-49]